MMIGNHTVKIFPSSPSPVLDVFLVLGAPGHVLYLPGFRGAGVYHVRVFQGRRRSGGEQAADRCVADCERLCMLCYSNIADVELLPNLCETGLWSEHSGDSHRTCLGAWTVGQRVEWQEALRFPMGRSCGCLGKTKGGSCVWERRMWKFSRSLEFGSRFSLALRAGSVNSGPSYTFQDSFVPVVLRRT